MGTLLLDLDDAPGQDLAGESRLVDEASRHPARQVREECVRLDPADRVPGLVEKRGLVVGVEVLLRQGVHHEGLFADGDHRSTRVATRREVPTEQGPVELIRLLQDPFLDPASGQLGKRQQQWVGVLGLGGDVDDTEQRTAHRVVDQGPRAGELAEVSRVVVAATDEDRATHLQCGSDAVRADVGLAVAETWSEVDRVEGSDEGPVTSAAAEDDTAAVGEDQAHRLVRELG